MTRGFKAFMVGAMAVGLGHPLLAQLDKLEHVHTNGGTLYTPESSVYRPEDIGKRARTFVRIFVPDGGLPIQAAANTPGGFFETPASLACVYQIAGGPRTCNPSTATAVSHLGSQAIAVVDAYDYPNAASDLAAFSTEFGLPAANLHVFYAAPGSSSLTNTPPPQDSSGGWESEAAIDIEMAHAMAPHARIYLVEANSSGSGDMLPAVTLASNLVVAAGGGEVSMSWGFGDFSGENGWDSFFTVNKIVYFSSSGDSAGISYPCTSPNVVCVGGTTISRNATTGNFEAESAWYNTGGGPSPNEPIPSYQSSISSIVGTERGTPDVAAVGDGRTPVWFYDTFPINGQSATWWLGSGTSVSSPLMAGLVNAAGNFYASSNAELTEIYSQIGVSTEFRDIANGNCGNYAGFLATRGWDFCTGVGASLGRAGK